MHAAIPPWSIRVASPLLGLVGLLAACGGSSRAPLRKATPAPVRVVEAPPPPREERTNENDDLQIEGALGSIDMNNVQRVLQGQAQALNDCQSRNVGRLWYVGGQMTLKFRIARDGSIKALSVPESDVGNFAIERCVRDLAQKLDFGLPVRGEAEFSFPINFDMRGVVKPYNPPRLLDVLEKKLDLKVCKKASAKVPEPEGGAQIPDYTAIFYVTPNGRVTSVGFNGDPVPPPVFAECLVARLKALTVPSLGDQIIKATYAHSH